jgi:hypothetical protein
MITTIVLNRRLIVFVGALALAHALHADCTAGPFYLAHVVIHLSAFFLRQGRR